MDEGTIGRNASAMRENVSHILTKVSQLFLKFLPLPRLL